MVACPHCKHTASACTREESWATQSRWLFPATVAAKSSTVGLRRGKWLPTPTSRGSHFGSTGGQCWQRRKAASVRLTGLTRVTAIMNIRGGLHHKMFAAIANSIQCQLYGVAADTLAESRSTVHRVHAEMYGPCVGPRHLDVSYDGTWKKRGFQSPFGVGFVIDTLTGLVIDYAVLSKYCVECEQVDK